MDGGSRQIWRAGENWPDDLYMFVQAGEMDPGAERAGRSLPS